jgi:hypothetical protein
MHEAVIVGEAVAGESAKTRAMLVSLINSVNKSTLDIAELLAKVKKHGYYQAEHSTFKEYTESLDIKARKAQYLTRIVECFESVGIPRTQYEKLGIAKLREISSLEYEGTYTNPVSGEKTPLKEFVTEFVSKGSDMDLDELKKHVRTLKGFVGENDIEWVNLPFTKSVLDNTIRPAAELTRANIGSVGKDDEGISKDASMASVIEVWAVEYLNDPSNNPQNQQVAEEEPDEAEVS